MDFHNIHKFVYVTNHYVNQKVSQSLVKGFEAQPVYSQRTYDRKFKELVDQFPFYEGLSIFYGLLRGCGTIMQECSATNRPYLYVDHSYFSQTRADINKLPFSGYFRCIKNDRYTHEQPDRPDDRFEKLKVELMPWRNEGDHIVVTPMSQHVARYNNVNADAWLQATLETLAKYTKRPLVLKPKDSDVPLSEALKNAWALVTLDSNAAVNAALQGVPVFCSQRAAAAPVGNFAYQDIEDPLMPDRQQWLNNLAYMQFTISEIEDGVAARILYGEHDE